MWKPGWGPWHPWHPFRSAVSILPLHSTLRKSLPPPHVQVIADALADSVQVALIAGTLSDNGDEVAASVLRQLGPDIGRRVRVFNCNQSRGEGVRSVHTSGLELLQILLGHPGSCKGAGPVHVQPGPCLPL